MKKLNLLFFTLTFITAMSSSAFGCLCSFYPDNPKEAKSWSQAVFAGEIIAFEREGNNAIFTFKVDRVWKGVSEKQVVLVDMTWESSCDAGLRLGQRYIVFASNIFFDFRYPDGKYMSPDKEGKPRWVIDTCSWSTNLSNTERSKKVLKRIGKGRLIN